MYARCCEALATGTQMKATTRSLLALALLFPGCCGFASPSAATVSPLHLQPADVIPTGNQWVSLPDISAETGSLSTFNVLSMQHRGLLQVAGSSGAPVISATFSVDGKPLSLHNPEWSLIEYWTPVAQQVVDGIELTLTWCAPPDSRGAFLRLTMTNRRAVPAKASLGVHASFGALYRVTYNPVLFNGTHTAGLAPWVPDGAVFSSASSDTDFAWSIVHPGSQGAISLPPVSIAPEVQATRTQTLAPGERMEAMYVLGAGVEEFAAAHAAKALRELLDREGADALIAETAAWCAKHTRHVDDPKLNLLMNRNLLFSTLFAWGRTLDTEQFVGVTARTPRYYVSAAYWDRDAMLWSFPALLDTDTANARDALEYALTIQLRNTGTHSRFITGGVLEDGFQLDEACAPIIALAEYVANTDDVNFLRSHADAVTFLRDRLQSRFDAATGLYTSLQDSQDEYQKRQFLTFDNALTWKALLDLSTLFDKLDQPEQARDLQTKAAALKNAILQHTVVTGPEGSGGTMFAAATDGSSPLFVEIPPGSLMRLPALGFVSEDDPVFQRTYAWLHSPHYKWSYYDQTFGVPGSYRVDSSTAWEIADHLLLKRGKERALKIMRESPWDGGIVAEGLYPSTGAVYSGRAFATAAGYVAHTICQVYCTDK